MKCSRHTHCVTHTLSIVKQFFSECRCFILFRCGCCFSANTFLIYCFYSPVINNINIIIIVLSTRFVGPFSDLIHSWEKTLSLIYEIIDQWVNFTQRKWLYLEGIFVENDARIKLPTIAAQFDVIDGKYIQVWPSAHPTHQPLLEFIDFWALKKTFHFINFLSSLLFHQMILIVCVSVLFCCFLFTSSASLRATIALLRDAWHIDRYWKIRSKIPA